MLYVGVRKGLRSMGSNADPKFLVAEGCLSCTFPHAYLLESPGDRVVTFTFALKA